MVVAVLEGLFLVLSGLSAAWLLLTHMLTWVYFRWGSGCAADGVAPPASVIRPVFEAGQSARGELRSFCAQNYPGDYEVLFCAERSDTVSIPVIPERHRGVSTPGCTASADRRGGFRHHRKIEQRPSRGWPGRATTSSSSRRRRGWPAVLPPGDTPVPDGPTSWPCLQRPRLSGLRDVGRRPHERVHQLARAASGHRMFSSHLSTERSVPR